MLPPEMTHTVFLFSVSTFPNMTAATEEAQDRRRDFGIGDGDDVVDILPAEGERQLPGFFDGNAVGDGADFFQLHDFAFPDRFVHARRAGRLYADDPAFRLDLLHGKGDAADETAAADRDHDRVGFGQLADDFKADGALPGDDFLIVKGMRERISVLFCQLHGFGIGVVIDAVYQYDFRAIALCGLYF